MAQATAAGYPVTFSVQQANRFQRAGILLRMALWVVIGSAPVSIVFLFGPVITAILIMRRGGDGFLSEYGPKYQRILRFIMGANAYLLFCTDVIPSWEKPEEGPTQLEIRTTGSPSVGSALLRYIMAYPHLLILGILGWVSMILWLVAAVAVLMNETVPADITRFQRRYLTWDARALAYYLSLVEEYPPFRLGD